MHYTMRAERGAFGLSEAATSHSSRKDSQTPMGVRNLLSKLGRKEIILKVCASLPRTSEFNMNRKNLFTEEAHITECLLHVRHDAWIGGCRTQGEEHLKHHSAGQTPQ
jgi:hypothetical protein